MRENDIFQWTDPHAAPSQRTGYVGSAAEFPPTLIPAQAVRPFRGAVVPGRPDDPRSQGVEVLMGLRVNVPGEFGFRHVVVDYRIGGERHRIRVEDGFVMCGGPDYPRCDLDAFSKPED